MYKIINLCVLMTVLVCCDGARILGIVPTPSYSHQVVFRPIWRELSLRGHHVTLLTTDPMNDPSLTNLTEIDLHFTYEPLKKILTILTDKSNTNPIALRKLFISMVNKINDLEFENVEVQKLIKNESEHFDLVIAEFLFPTMLVFSHRFNCPFIGMTSLDAASHLYKILGNPVHPVANPDFHLRFIGKLTFMERVLSTLYNLLVNYLYYSALPNEDLLIEKHFGKGYPPLHKIQTKMSMLFVNADPIFHQVRPTLPSIVHIGGGIHVQTKAKPLPVELQKILDESSQGFIYFSLGSNVKSGDLSEETRNNILQVFAELPYQVLWKSELDELPGKPDNVLISPWFPQQDIFKHPNIKLFITQGGLQSMEEAIYNHIPMIGIPFYMDQPSNVKLMVSKGLALFVDRESINKDDFKRLILEVINNPKYRNKVKELAELAQDQPMTGLARAVWWTEYVLRHKGAKHLRSPAMDLPAYQYFLLDVIGFCLLVIAVVVCMLLVIVKLLIKLVKYFISKPKVKLQ